MTLKLYIKKIIENTIIIFIFNYYAILMYSKTVY